MPNGESEQGSKYSRLIEAGIIVEGAYFAPEDVELIESLSWEEIEAIVSIRDKLGPEFFARHLKMELIF